VIAGTPLNDRYLLVTMALLCVSAAAPVALLREAGAPRLVGAGCLALLVVGAVFQAPRFIDRRDDLADRDARRNDAHAVLEAGIPCRPLVVPNRRMFADVATWLDLPLDDVRDGRDGIPPGSYLWATPEAAENILVIENRPGGMAPAPSAPVIRQRNGWTLMARCDR
jgi:hypothetical protein